MNKFILSLSSFACTLLLLSSCTSWTTPEQKQIEHIGGYNTMDDAESQEYYAQLRAYKKQAENYGRPVAFGWFSNWSPSGLIRKGYLESIPDSMDIVSIWSGNWPLSEAKKKDMRLVQEKKGTKILACSLLSYVGKGCTPQSVLDNARKEGEEQGLSGRALDDKVLRARWAFWGFESGVLGADDHKLAIANFAKALADSLEVNHYDGFDIDWEPGNGFNDADGTLTGSQEYIALMVQELSKYIGPKSDKGNGHKLLVIDGQVTGMPSELGSYFDYFIIQAYGRSNPYMENIPQHYGEEHGSMKKVIITENFESYSGGGGNLLNQAAYNPAAGPKGGFGAYRFDNDYNNIPDYKWMRQGIQLNQKAYKEYMEKKQNSGN